MKFLLYKIYSLLSMAVKKNYLAWEIEEKDYPKNGSSKEKIIFLLRYGILAPSAHNTQPWFFVVNDNQLLIYLNKDRSLSPISDTSGRQTYVGLGACLKNIKLAATFFGLEYQIEYLDKEEEEKKVLVAKIIFFEKQELAKIDIKAEQMFKAIVNRHSAKLGYKKEPIDNIFLDVLKNIDKEKFLDLSIIVDPGVIKKLSIFAVEGTKRAFKSKEFRIELSHWVKNSISAEPDGMPGFTVGIPWLFSFIAPTLIRCFNIGTIQAQMTAKLLKESPGAIIISTENNSKIEWIKAGELMEEVCLLSVQAGYGVMPLGAPVEYDDITKHLQKDLGLQCYPGIFLRIGRSKKKLSLAPRLDLEDVMKLI